MCTNSEIANRVAHSAMDNVISKIQLTLKDHQFESVKPIQDMWLPVPKETLENGYMKMQGLGHDASGSSFLQVKMEPNSESVIHHHERIAEKFMLLKGKLCYQVYHTASRELLKRKGCLENLGQIEVFEPGEWHVVLTTEVETYVLIVYKHL